MAATDSATRRGSPSSSGSGCRVDLAEVARRVHWSPPMRKVALAVLPALKMFGQLTLAHRVQAFV
jgi:hypothetical protein